MYWVISVQSSAGAAGNPDLISSPVVCEMGAMALDSLQKHLQEHFHPASAGSLDATFRLAINDETLTFHVGHGLLEFVESERCDATFYFADENIARALLSGQADAFEAFMHGRFKADGYLMWAFVLMAMFRGTGLPDAPVE